MGRISYSTRESGGTTRNPVEAVGVSDGGGGGAMPQRWKGIGREAGERESIKESADIDETERDRLMGWIQRI